MNILIVGNGYDLSHYLPTKYDHFMAVMQAVQNWDMSKGDMQFDDLFSDLYEKEAYFFGYTKAMYDTNTVKLTVAEIEEIKVRLEQNVWYQYFLDHVREVKTWIDFETKMAEALELVGEFFNVCSDEYDKLGFVHKGINDLSKGTKLNSLKIKKLQLFNLVLSKEKSQTYLNEFYWNRPKIGAPKGFIVNNKFFVGGVFENGFDFSKYQSYLMIMHRQFVETFNRYLIQVSTLIPYKPLQKPLDSPIDKVYSFNYTSSAKNFYEHQVIEYIHGQIGEKNNIVLGVSDLDETALKNFKMYGFTKYHQKLLKNTDYIFLNEFYRKLLAVYKMIERKNNLDDRVRTAISGDGKTKMKQEIFNLSNSINSAQAHSLKDIIIWGHSLDVSDKDYIKEIFSFNTEIDQRVTVKIFYFNDQAKFDLLSNLLHILGKEKVETWMKNKWLIFEPNPNIAELNGITPVDLSGYHNTASS